MPRSTFLVRLIEVILFVLFLDDLVTALLVRAEPATRDAGVRLRLLSLHERVALGTVLRHRHSLPRRAMDWCPRPRCSCRTPSIGARRSKRMFPHACPDCLWRASRAHHTQFASPRRAALRRKGRPTEMT